MNKACKVIWSHAQQQMVVVSELVSSRGKAKSFSSKNLQAVKQKEASIWTAKALVVYLALAFGALIAPPGFAQSAPAGLPGVALPTGGSVAAGSAAISSNGANMLIDQASQRAVINWQSFNVGQDAHVHFNNAGGSTLNRVNGPEASTILGRITAPGQVIISNGNGVFFGRGSMVDVGSLIGTTHQISDEHFMAGNLTFERSGATGSVVNEGELRAEIEGYIALLAPEVRNQGLIVAHKGTVALAAGEVVELQIDPGNKLTNIRVEASQWQALVDNRHAIEAEGGLVILSAMAARELQGSVVSNSGSINANSMANVGGRIILTGDQINLKSGSSMTATGALGGGQVLVGGDWQGGANSEKRVFDDPNALYQATTVNMEQGASIDASATNNGTGGTVVLWADADRPGTETNFGGTIKSRGGAQGGDGGNVETSAYALNVNGGMVNAGADNGVGGLWYIDPTDSVITQTVANSYAATLNTGTSVLNDVVGNITWNSGVSLSKTAGGDATLTLRSRNSSGDSDISLNNATISSTAGALNLVLWTRFNTLINAGSVSVLGSNLNTNGGHIWIGGGAQSSTDFNGLTVGQSPTTTFTANSVGLLIRNSTINTAGGDISATGDSFYVGGTMATFSNGLQVDNSSISTGTGDITLTGSDRGNYSAGSGIELKSNSSISTTSGNISLTGTASATFSPTNRVFGTYLNNKVLINSDSGSISVSGSTTANSPIGAGLWIGSTSVAGSTASGNLTTGLGAGYTAALISNSGNISLNGQASTAARTDGSQHGWANVAYGSDKVLIKTGTGSITGNGSANLARLDSVGTLFQVDSTLGGIDVVSSSGNISLTGTQSVVSTTDLKTGLRFAPAATAGSIRIGSINDDPASYTGNITINGDSISNNTSTTTAGAVKIIGSGELSFLPTSGSFSRDFLLPTNWDLGTQHSILTIGKSTNTANVTIGNAQTVTNDFKLFGGNIALNGALTGTSSNSSIQLQTNGNVTQTAALSAAKLDLQGTGNFTLTNTANNIGVLAGGNSTTRLGSLAYVNAGALTVGTAVNSSGLAVQNDVNISTITGDLTVQQAIDTQSTTATAVTLNAGSSAAAGTATGGDIDLLASVTTGTNGRTRLFTGSVSGSNGLTSAVGSGSGNFRYNADETTNISAPTWKPIADSGLFAIYREQPTVNIQSATLSMTYGDSLPQLNVTGLANGDSAEYTITNPLFSSTNKLRAGSQPYTINSPLALLGYNVTGPTSGTLNVAAKALDISGLTASNKVYDALLGATLTGTETITQGGTSSTDGRFITGDSVSLTGTETGTFADKNVGVGKTVTVSGLSLTGVDASNYTLKPYTLQANITKANLSVSGATAANKVYDTTTTASVTGTVTALQSDMITLSSANATFADQHAGNNKAVTTAYTLSGIDAGNYNLIQPVGLTANITPKQITLVAPATTLTKVYDGTTNAPAGTNPAWSFTGLEGSDTSANIAFTSADYNSKDVLNANTVAFTGLSITGIVGNSGSRSTDYVLSSSTANLAGTITPASLTVSANNDAKFVTQTDVVNYTGVGYKGFVNGENASVLGGNVSVTRSNTGVETAGIYSDVLNASGLTSSNYNIAYEAGDYTIVPADQLLVRVTNESNSYGTATQYSIDSVEYMTSGGMIFTLSDGSVNNSSVSVDANNQVAIEDGAGGAASFTLAPQSPVLSTAGKLTVGNYQLGINGVVTENSQNFSDTITIVGAHQVNAKALTASATNVSKVYDGTTNMTGVTLGLNTLETGDVVRVDGIGAFSQKNVGSNLNYTLSNLALSDTDSANYFLSGGTSFSGNDGSITPRTITLAFTGIDKVYDGNTQASVNVTDNRIGLDDVNFSYTSLFSDKNVGTDKTVSVSMIDLSGADSGNYTLNGVTTGSTTADITRLDSVTWVGGATGNWFDPANWAGGAVPDLSNVANVIIPQGVVVTFDNTATGDAVAASTLSNAVNIDSLGTLGSLQHTEGFLNIGSGGLTLNSLTQTGGSLSNSGDTTLASFTQTGGTTSTMMDFTVTDSFSQTGDGTLTVGGNTSITDLSGGLTVGNINTTGTTSLTSVDGAITQTSNTTLVSGGAATITAQSQQTPSTSYDVILNGATNDFMSTVNVVGQNVTLQDANGLTLGTVTSTADLSLETNGPLDMGTSNIGGDLTATTNNGDITQTGPLTVGGTSNLNSGTADITLTNMGNDFVGPITATGDDINIYDGSNLTATINATGDTSLTSVGNLVVSGTTQDLTTTTTGSNSTITFGQTTTSGDLTATTNNGDITQTGPLTVSGTSNLNSGTADITLTNMGNDFVGPITATGDDINIYDGSNLTATINATGDTSLTSVGNLVVSGTTQDLTTTTTGSNSTTTFGNTTVNEDLSSTTNNGNMNQTGPLIVTGNTDLVAGTGTIILLDTGNTFVGDINATGSLVLINGATKNGAEQAAITSAAIIANSTGSAALTNSMLEVSSTLNGIVLGNTTAISPVSGSDSNTGSASNTAGIEIEVKELPVGGLLGFVSVTLPAETSTSGTGFLFTLPLEIKEQMSANVQVSLVDGSPLPSWLSFNPDTSEFTATAVPDQAFPIQVKLVSNGKQIVVVISEKQS